MKVRMWRMGTRKRPQRKTGRRASLGQAVKETPSPLFPSITITWPRSPSQAPPSMPWPRSDAKAKV